MYHSHHSLKEIRIHHVSTELYVPSRIAETVNSFFNIIMKSKIFAGLLAFSTKIINVCPLAQCEDLQLPSDGNVTMVTNGTITSVTFSCDVGFTLDGDAQPECQTNGTWTAVQQTCGGFELIIITVLFFIADVYFFSHFFG